MNKISNETITEVFYRPLTHLVGEAQQMHLKNFPEGGIQASSLLSIKTGGCPENCSYCPQSAHYDTGVGKTKLMGGKEVFEAAQKAKDMGASRFCMGAAWREVKDGPDFDHVLDLVTGVSEMGLEVCCTLGMLNQKQAAQLKKAGLNFYNHNIDTSPEYYEKVIQTRTFQDRLDTIEKVRDAGIHVCTGGIIGMGETEADRISFIETLVNMKPQPESITINSLVPIEGTPLEESKQVEALDLVRVIATLRVLAPKSMIRLSAGRAEMSQEGQFLCFLAGANSIFLGDKLLTSPNPEASEDFSLLRKSGLRLSGPSPHVSN